MANTNIISTFKSNVSILFASFLLFCIINCAVFFWGMNSIVENLDNSYIMYKTPTSCYALKATRQVTKKELNRGKLDSAASSMVPVNSNKLYANESVKKFK